MAIEEPRSECKERAVLAVLMFSPSSQDTTWLQREALSAC